ncbi:MAG: glycine--tRNA ligase subunit beta [Deltaproteobacteria bacterium]|nr:glycine--tRNA ligase subunit beta [Deltaproteobacteria bacterium]
MVTELLLEIGTEEIPAGYLAGGLKELSRLAEVCLRDNRIDVAEGLQAYGTPRRLVLIGKGLSEMQSDLVKEMTGPPKSVAYDTEGRPTKAALGFAQKQGVPIEEVQCIDTPKGEYLYVKRKIPGKRTAEILAETLPQLIADIPWPKSMRWGSTGFSFVRPIHWVLCLLNNEVISFDVAGVRSAGTTRGHRFMGPEAIEISGVQDYLREMEQAFVVIDPEERERVVERVTLQAAQKVGGRPGDDPELVSIVANLVEYPTAVCGSFDVVFLDLPDIVLITAMKEHQKYFAVYDDEGRLMPNFVAVNNTISKDESVVQRGHERVLRARLSDADFFLKEDRKVLLKDRLDGLRKVVYQADLGTSYAKVQRFTRLAEYVAGMVLPEEADSVRLVANLCKCDLITQMVGEFPSLQGVMGKVYARLEGYPEDVCSGIYEHYLPLRAGGQLPTSKIGAVVGIADRIDTIAGCFAVGLEPSGSADPFALRRHALAIIRIIEDMGWDLSLKALIREALSLLGGEMDFDADHIFSKVTAFVRERYKHMMIGSDYESDLVEAVISADFDSVRQLRPKIDQLKVFSSESEEFHQLSLTVKRVNNILKKQDTLFSVNPTLFREDSEDRLWKTYLALKDDVYGCLETGRYLDALNLMVKLRKPVDEFFDGVEVLTKDDQALRENRVGVLQHIADLMCLIADFSKFSI